MKCRPGCGACCVAISISSPLPNMPGGKPAGVRCLNLSDDNTCRIHGAGNYPRVCRDLAASEEMCGSSHQEALERLTRLERLTDPQ